VSRVPEAQIAEARDSPRVAAATGPGSAVREYIETVCGGRVRGGIVEDAVAQIADIEGAMVLDRDGYERVREIARLAAFAEARRSARSIGPRLRHVSRGRRGHAKVPDLLRKRAVGLISEADLNWLYRSLADCAACGDLATRLDDAEWRLNLALTEIMRSPRSRDVAADEPPPAADRVAPAETNGRAGTPERLVRPTAQPSKGLGRFPSVLAVVLIGSGCAVTSIEILHHPAAAHPTTSASAAATATSTPPIIFPAILFPLVAKSPAKPDRDQRREPPPWLLG
jgi:hypothetical protein